MSKKENKKSNQVVKDMKECFRSFNLPVDKNKHDKESKIAFTSEICNDHVCAGVVVTHDKQRGYGEIKIESLLEIPSERVIAVIKLLDLFNGMMPFDHYSVCPCCNSVVLKTALFLPDDGLPIGKFKRLIRNILEHTYLGFPLIYEVMIGGNPEDASVRFREGYKALREMSDTMSDDAAGTVLRDMESVLHDHRITLQEEDRFDDGFIAAFGETELTDFVLSMIIQLFRDRALVVLELFPSFTIPDEKIVQITESINWVNRYFSGGCMFLDREDKQVRFRKGIMIDNNVLDKRELNNAIRNMLSGVCVFFPSIMDQLASNEGLETLMDKRRESFKNCNQESE